MRYKPRCNYPTHTVIHPIYYRDSDGRMIRAEDWYACPRCIEEQSCLPMHYKGRVPREVLNDFGLNRHHQKAPTLNP